MSKDVELLRRLSFLSRNGKTREFERKMVRRFVTALALAVSVLMLTFLIGRPTNSSPSISKNIAVPSLQNELADPVFANEQELPCLPPNPGRFTLCLVECCRRLNYTLWCDVEIESGKQFVKCSVDKGGAPINTLSCISCCLSAPLGGPWSYDEETEKCAHYA